MTPPIAAVAFDKDGVTFDSERIYAESLLQTLVALPQPPADAQALVDACSGLSSAATAALLQQTLGADIDMDAFFRRWFAQRDAIIATRGVPFMPGADTLIEALYAAGYPLALVTADDLDNVLADFQRCPQPELLQRFSVVITADDVANTKPDPEPYQRAAAYLGVAPEAMLVLEDSDVGAQAALAAGCPVFLLAADRQPAPQIAQAVRRIIHHHVREKLPLEPALFETLVGKPPEVYLKVLGEALGQEMALDDFIAHWFALRDTIFAEEGAPFMPGADRLIEYLHAAGVPLALVTGDFRRNVEQDFARCPRPELFQCFAVVISHDDVARPKPDPQPYQMAAAALGVAPENLLVVEDSPPGVLAAVEAGCRTLILPGYGMITADLAARAWRTVSHHDEVREIFDAHRA